MVEFLKLWQLPECGQRTLPLMHKLKALAGIVEPRNPSRRLDKRPGMCVCGGGGNTWCVGGDMGVWGWILGWKSDR